MKKVLFFFALVLGLTTTVANAQTEARLASTSGNPRAAGIGIQFKGRNCAGIGFRCIQIDLLGTANGSDLMAANVSTDAAGKPVLTVNAKNNPELVRLLQTERQLVLDNDVVLSPDVARRITNGKHNALVLSKGTYPLENSNTSTARAKPRITIKWKDITIIIEW